MTASATQTTSVAQDLRGLLQRRLIQMIVLTGLLTGVAARAMWLKFSVLDLDIWWHLKVGDWIIEHRAFPHSGILSRTAADRPWAAYSWGYELMLSRAYAWFGLAGVGLFGVLLTVAVAYAVYWMLRRLSGRFWVACILATLSCWAFLFNMMPRPVFLSIILYAVTLTLIFESQRDGRIRRLYWLPLVFLVWANCHIQFIYGLAVVGVFAGVQLAQHLAQRVHISTDFALPSTVPTGKVLLIFAACALATCLGPYTYHLYFIVFSYAGSTFPYAFIREFRSLNFRDVTHYVELLLCAAAFFTLGRRKRVDLFQLALLIVTSMVAFRTMRDSWYLCLAAAACIANSWGQEVGRNIEPEPGETLPEKAGLAAALALLLYLVAINAGFNMRGLDDAMSSQFPVKAVNFLRRNPQPGPLYNTFDWGGFLTWYMPDYPVAIDGRTDLYGDDLDFLFFNSERGDPSYVNDPYLNQAGVILLDKTKPLATVLSGDQRFQKIYEDHLAMVFVRRPSQP
ncbi:MAG: hypothetical protein ABSB39_01495 [Candidatus Sulfotelmatobacter sp.]|jgi:hypothetical protein